LVQVFNCLIQSHYAFGSQLQVASGRVRGTNLQYVQLHASTAAYPGGSFNLSAAHLDSADACNSLNMTACRPCGLCRCCDRCWGRGGLPAPGGSGQWGACSVFGNKWTLQIHPIFHRTEANFNCIVPMIMMHVFTAVHCISATASEPYVTSVHIAILASTAKQTCGTAL
jgi:hypothetical protein